MTPLLSVFVLAASTFATPFTLSAPASVERTNFDGGFTATATCIVDCGELNNPVACSASTCTGVDRSYPGELGHVTCNGTTTYCPAFCTNGQIKSVFVGPTCGCEDGMTTPRDRYQCVNGNWEFQYSFCGGPFCQG
jgi:hypothetical protein